MSPISETVGAHWLAALALLVAGTWPSAHAAGRTEGLADADRVLREAAPSSDADAAVRRHATLLVLGSAARRISTADGARPQPDDLALVAGYQRALQQQLREAAQSGPPDCAGERCPAAQLTQQALALARSPGFAQGVIERFASPAWQQAHGPALLARTAGPAPASGPARTVNRAPAPPPPPPPPPEPPRELRSANGVDMTVLGLAMGEPVRLPPCATTAQGNAPLATMIAGLERALAPTTTVCQNVSETSASGRAALGVKLPADRCPSWLNVLCLVSGTLQRGRLLQIEIGTRGLEVEQELVGILRQKYGKPSSARRTTWSNAAGGRWEVEELTWDLKDLVVEFKPMAGQPNVGRLFVTTPEGRRFLDSERQRESAAQPRL